MVVDSQGSELVEGNKVTLSGKIISIKGDELVIEVDTQFAPAPMVTVKSPSVTRVGDSDMLKAARKGFNDRNG